MAKPTAEQMEMQDRLRKILVPGTVVRTISRHTSKSGMSRSISVVVNTPEGMVDLDWMIVRAGLGYRFDNKHDGIKVGGCGMDMGFHLVYSLSRSLYPNGYKCSGHDGTGRKPRCRSNDHTNYRSFTVVGDWDPETREWVGRVANPKKNYSRGRIHRDGGYALSHAWL